MAAPAGQLHIINGIVVTLNSADDVYFGGSVVLDGAHIAYVGPKLPIEAHASSANQRVINAADKVVMPGFVDLHYHTGIGKGWNDHLPLQEWLDTAMYPLIRVLDPESAYWAALEGYASSLRAGVTTVNDMHLHLEPLAEAARESGIRATLSHFGAEPQHELNSLGDTADSFRALHGAASGRISVRVGIETVPLASQSMLRQARALADDLATGLHIHLNESLGEVEMSKELFGRTSLETAYDCGLLGSDCIAAHCVVTSDSEIALLAETHTHVAHNPSSNAKLGNGIARVPEMLRAGLNVGLGHDAVECNNSCDMFEAMKWACLLQRASRKDASVLQARDVLQMATRNGARALGHRSGQLAPGFKADLVLLDAANHIFTPLMPESYDHVRSHLVYAADSSCVDTVIVDGDVICQDGRLTRIDEDLVRRNANQVFRTLIGRL